jgi:pullulanase/glycogen debranching enzyme
VALCLFDAHGRSEVARIELPDCTDEMWHGYVPDLPPGTACGYRVHAPYEPAGTDSTRTSGCSTRTRARTSAGWSGTMRVSDTRSVQAAAA